MIKIIIILLFINAISILKSSQLSDKEYEVINIAIKEFIRAKSQNEYSKLYVSDSTIFNVILSPENDENILFEIKEAEYYNWDGIDSILYSKLIDNYYKNNKKSKKVGIKKLNFNNIVLFNYFDFKTLMISPEIYEKFKNYFNSYPSKDFLSGRAIEKYGKNNLFLFISVPAFYDEYSIVWFFYFIPESVEFYHTRYKLKKIKNEWMILNKD